MKLSKLIYNVVKNVIYLSDTGFTYASFINGDYDNNPDYITNINNAFAPLNEGIHRLSDLHKLKNKLVKLPAPDNKGVITLTDELKADIKTILNVVYLGEYDYIRIEFRELGADKIYLIGDYDFFNKDLYVEYIEDIPNFDKEDIYHFEEGGIVVSNDIELKDYGINDTMCSYLIEYCQGRLQEPIAPELANMHLSRAEQYFNDLDDQNTNFNQKVITNKGAWLE